MDINDPNTQNAILNKPTLANATSDLNDNLQSKGIDPVQTPQQYNDVAAWMWPPQDTAPTPKPVSQPQPQAAQPAPQPQSYVDKVKQVLLTPQQQFSLYSRAAPAGASNVTGNVTSTPIVPQEQMNQEGEAAGLNFFRKLVPGGTAIARATNPESEALAEQRDKEYPGLRAIDTGVASALQMALAKGIPVPQALQGAKLLPTIGRNALSAAPFAAASGIDTGATTGDVGKGLESAGLTEGIGAILGFLSEGVSRLFGKSIPKLKQGVLNQSLTGDLDIKTRALRYLVNKLPPGAQTGAIERVKEGLNTLANETAGTVNDISTLQGMKNQVEKMNGEWDTLVNQKFEPYKANGGKISDFRDEIYADPNVKELIDSTSNPETVTKELDNIIKQVSDRADLEGIGSARNFLQKRIISPGDTFAHPQASNDLVIKNELGEAVHDVIDAKFVPDELKADYPVLKIMKKALAMDASTISPLTKTGSKTGVVMGLMKHGAAFLANPFLGAASVLGDIGNEAAAESVNKATGKAATRLYPAIKGLTGEGLVNASPAIGDTTSKIGALLTGKALNQSNAPAPESISGPQKVQLLPSPGTAQASVPTQAPGAQPGATVQDRQSSGQQQLTQAIQDYYDKHELKSYMPFDKDTGNPYTEGYLQRARRWTNNGDPTNETTAKFLHPGNEYEQKNFLKMAEIASRTSKQDWLTAIDNSGKFGQGSTLRNIHRIFGNKEQLAADQISNAVVSSIPDLAPGDKNEAVKGFAQVLAQIKYEYSDPDKRFNALSDFMYKNYGVNLKQMHDMGIME